MSIQDPSHPLSHKTSAVFSSRVSRVRMVDCMVSLEPRLPLTNIRGSFSSLTACTAFSIERSLSCRTVTELTSRKRRLLWFPLGVPFNSLYFPPFIASLSPSALCCYFPLYFIIISFITSCLHGFYRPLVLL